MGGGGSYYDRDVTSPQQRTARGYSKVAESEFSRSNVNSAVLPKNRKLVSTNKSPLVYGFDVTGSMDSLPKTIWDKMPMIAGELTRQEYLSDPAVSLAAVGDVVSDQGPIQICDFTQVRSLDESLTRLWLEGGGGGQQKESYEFTAYFYLRHYDMQNATTPIFLFTGDEGFREQLSANELRAHFGGEHQNISARTVFNELKEKFRGNVFIIRRPYGTNTDADKTIQKQWEGALGAENVIPLPEDIAIADITLGVIAIASGARTLDEYIQDIKTRPLNLGNEKFKPQSQERIAEVRKALEKFAAARAQIVKKEVPIATSDSKKETKVTKTGPSKKKKPGRII